MGQSDGVNGETRKILKNRIFGITCHNSRKLAKKMLKYNPNYLAFGSFYKSRLKPKAIKANLSILKWAKKNIKTNRSYWWNKPKKITKKFLNLVQIILQYQVLSGITQI